METARKNPNVNCENAGNTNITLPEEIITDIISRLPVKQVFQLQCLSKNFASITNDLNFINAHLGRSARLCPSIILNKGNDIFFIQSNESDSETTVKEVPLHQIIDLTGSAKKLKIEASCNGLVIFSVGERDYFIWNPATTKCNRLPTPSYIDGKCFMKAEWGFGYCSKSSQYKIVRIAYYYEGTSWGDGEMVAEVLNYVADCKWRRLDYSNFDDMCAAPGITAKGVVYWTVIYDKLLSFDLEEEEFAWVTCPFGACSKIMEFRGSLAACKLSRSSKNAYDIYVFKKAGNVDSWEMICTIGDIFPSFPIIFLNDHQLFLVDKKSKHDVFYRYEEDKVEFSCSLYDLKRKEIKRIPQALASNSSDVHNFVGSMVPLLP